jgi:hypothetical protein
MLSPAGVLEAELGRRFDAVDRRVPDSFSDQSYLDTYMNPTAGEVRVPEHGAQGREFSKS